jgi:hypothetical protein
MRIQIYGSTYITQKVVELLKQYHKLVGYIPSENPDFPGDIDLPVGEFPHDIKLSIQYDRKIDNLENAYNLHTGLLPEYGGCNILYHVLKNKEKETGLTFHKMTEDFDFGEIVSKITCPVLSGDSILELYRRISKLAPAFALSAITVLPTVGEKKKPVLYLRKDIDQKESEENVETISSYLKQRSCKVICICFAPREVRNEAVFPNHIQHTPTAEMAYKLVKDVLTMEMEADGGFPFDIIIVNNDTGCTYGNSYLDSLHGKKTKNGNIYVYHRHNKGGSFGAYNYAFEHTEYDEYLFTEDDIVIFGQDYYKKIRDRFYSDSDNGFIGMIGVNKTSRLGIHAHGGSGFTTRKILEKVFKEHKELPNSGDSWVKDDVIIEGEVAFTNAIDSPSSKVVAYNPTNFWNKEYLCLPYEEFIQQKNSGSC